MERQRDGGRVGGLKSEGGGVEPHNISMLRVSALSSFFSLSLPPSPSLTPSLSPHWSLQLYHQNTPAWEHNSFPLCVCVRYHERSKERDVCVGVCLCVFVHNLVPYMVHYVCIYDIKGSSACLCVCVCVPILDLQHVWVTWVCMFKYLFES